MANLQGEVLIPFPKDEGTVPLAYIGEDGEPCLWRVLDATTGKTGQYRVTRGRLRYASETGWGPSGEPRIFLETDLVFGRLCTSVEAVNRFDAALKARGSSAREVFESAPDEKKEFEE